MVALSTQTLSTVLDAILKNEAPPASNPLLNFTLVANLRPLYPEGEAAQLAMLREVLINAFCRIFDDLPASPAILTQYIDNPYLRDCAIVYLRYLRPEYPLSKIVSVAAVDERSIRRYIKSGAGYLCQHLIEMEVEARKENRVVVLKQRIPHPSGMKLYGREWIVGQAADGLRQGWVTLAGVPGIGKTVIAAAVCHRLLTEIEDLFWIKVHPELDIYAQIFDVVSETYLYQKDVLLVLDGVHPAQCPEQLRSVRILMTGDSFPAAAWEGLLLTVPPLEPDAIQQFCSDYRESNSPIFIESNVPGMLRNAIRYQDILPLQSSSVAEYYTRLWEGYPLELQQLWMLVGLSEQISYDEVIYQFGYSARDLTELAQSHVIELHGDHYQLTRTFQMEATIGFDNLVYQSAPHPIRLWLHLLNNGLDQHLHMDTLKWLLRRLSREMTGHWLLWEATLQQLKSVPGIWLDYEKARVLRWQGQLIQSGQLLSQMIPAMGAAGDFEAYACGLVELATVYSYRSHFDAARAALNDAYHYFDRVQDASGLLQVNLLLARLSPPDEALTLLKGIPQQTAAVYSALCEAALRMPDAKQAVHYAEQAIDHTEPNTAAYGRMLAMLARATHEAGDLRNALAYQEQSVNVLMQTQDVMGLARAKNNLGVLYHDAGEDDAVVKSVLRTAYDDFLRLQDAEGLQTVRLNLESVHPHVRFQ
jgi:tetratricopeptide (TPR) repeat protein